MSVEQPLPPAVQPDPVGPGGPAPTGGRTGLLILVLVALVVGLVGIGLGIAALSNKPATGPAGATGPQGPAGPAGPTGPQGPAGTISSATVVSATTLTSAPNPAVGTVLVAKTSCPTGKILLSGGAQVSATGGADQNVTLHGSFPLNESTWQAVGLVTAPLGAGVTMTMKPFVICGTATPAPTTTTTAPTTSTT